MSKRCRFYGNYNDHGGGGDAQSLYQADSPIAAIQADAQLTYTSKANVHVKLLFSKVDSALKDIEFPNPYTFNIVVTTKQFGDSCAPGVYLFVDTGVSLSAIVNVVWQFILDVVKAALDKISTDLVDRIGSHLPKPSDSPADGLEFGLFVNADGFGIYLPDLGDLYANYNWNTKHWTVGVHIDTPKWLVGAYKDLKCFWGDVEKTADEALQTFENMAKSPLF